MEEDKNIAAEDGKSGDNADPSHQTEEGIEELPTSLFTLKRPKVFVYNVTSCIYVFIYIYILKTL